MANGERARPEGGKAYGQFDRASGLVAGDRRHVPRIDHCWVPPEY